MNRHEKITQTHNITHVNRKKYTQIHMHKKKECSKRRKIVKKSEIFSNICTIEEFLMRTSIYCRGGTLHRVNKYVESFCFFLSFFLYFFQDPINISEKL
jgi:hypothetical protein